MFSIILLLSGDIELNPGPSKNSEIVAVLDSIKRVEEYLETIRSEIDDLKTVQAAQEKQISAISNRLDNLESPRPQTSNPSDNNSSQISREISVLKAATTDASNRLRRNNLLFLGIKDNAKETWEESEQRILAFCADKLKLSLDSGTMERAHRIGTFTENKNRPIIVKLAHFKTKERILACGRMLKDTDYAIREDFAAATRLARSKLLQFIRPQKCAFKLSLDKLHVNKRCYIYDHSCDKIVEINKISTLPTIVSESSGVTPQTTK